MICSSWNKQIRTKNSAIYIVVYFFYIRESSFNLTRGDGDIEGGAPKICILQNQQEGGRAPKKLNC